MEQNNHQTRSPPQKYLVLSVRYLKALIEMARQDQSEIADWNSVVVRCEHAGKNYPGQLVFTDEFRKETYPHWPEEEDIYGSPPCIEGEE